MRDWIWLALMVAFAATPVRAEMCSADVLPAATLLLPYFEVDLGSPSGATTLFSINNADARATLAHVTLWTDEAIPTVNFDVYLTGYDVQTINLRDLFAGQLPPTAPLDRDPGDLVSHRGPLSEDASMPGCGALPYGLPALDAAARDSLRLAHTGKFAPGFGGCLGADYGDSHARGYVTVDVATRCSTLDPTRAGYFTGVAGDRNVLWGSYAYVDPARDTATAETLVHIESCPLASQGSGPCSGDPGGKSFYGRYAPVAGKDRREPLPTTFASEYILAGAFSGGTDLIVWRDTRTSPSGANGPHACTLMPAWFPLEARDVVAFDEQERATDDCFREDNTLPVAGPYAICFPLATQRVRIHHDHPFAQNLFVPENFGWLYLDLQYPRSTDPVVAQAWVSVTHSAEGRFGVSADAVQLDRGCDARPGGELIP